MDQVLALAERNVPRYTSYPTAPHFSAKIGATRYGEWLAALPATASLSLYIHVPFCNELCHYCGCNTKAIRKREPVDAYGEVVLKEIDLVGRLAGGRKVQHLHWGGGTPSTLGGPLIGRMLERLSSYFDMSAMIEHAIELDPRHVDPELCKELAALGVNRVSFGVQDFAPQVQDAIGRRQSFETVKASADAVRNAGIANLNIDLMYGLPLQSVADAAESARLAASLKPQRLALFGYAHVPWFKGHQRLIKESDLPGATVRLEQQQVAAAELAKEGFMLIGLDHFAKPDDEMGIAAQNGTLRRNFQGYTVDMADALLPLGVSSIGRLPQGFVQNAPDMGGYTRAINEGKLATVKGLEFTADDILRGAVIERLMSDLGVDLDKVAPGHDFADEKAALVPLIQNGLATLDGNVITVTQAGRPFVRLVAAVFDTYLAANQARHSVAV